MNLSEATCTAFRDIGMTEPSLRTNHLLRIQSALTGQPLGTAHGTPLGLPRRE